MKEWKNSQQNMFQYDLFHDKKKQRVVKILKRSKTQLAAELITDGGE